MKKTTVTYKCARCGTHCFGAIKLVSIDKEFPLCLNCSFTIRDAIYKPSESKKTNRTFHVKIFLMIALIINMILGILAFGNKQFYIILALNHIMSGCIMLWLISVWHDKLNERN